MELTLRAQSLGVCATISGYGVYMHTDNPLYLKEYRIFGDCNANKRYNEGAGADVAVEVLQFEKGVKILSVSLDGTLKDQVHIFFIPPDPQVEINPGPAATAQVILQLENDPSRVKTLTINNKGVIDID